MRATVLATALATVLPLALAISTPAPAGEKAPAVERMKVGGVSPEEEAAAEKYFTNTELLDQHGRARHFYDDLLKRRKVLINFAFTACMGACPVMTQNLAKVQEMLRQRGEQVSILTITVDPENDTPAVLKQYATKYKAGPGWSFLTGTPEKVSAVLQLLGGKARQPSEHTAKLLIGDTSTGMWVKTVATESPETIVQLVQHLNDPK
ncbi:Cytochrome oxidase biogenesis protein Sco1/SenC/PrrC, putative copper metallochaperone [Chondromyces apiculatus DSM 436]|uniref:Cytochrome oxidase biogenesis protein Sco1/SenC/PrrC, putative copper metallochaperone n=1 Tax=Chondromyces apiculatus DSM 436 TaxID=1192034 RepID=A0A017SVU7_9BACT|nr:Cytochrome oxidase biogenesis protein Sco1/SenC/PrrC, putative copper metallochaperone [Chondromyces apiculatus DSM 436]